MAFLIDGGFFLFDDDYFGVDLEGSSFDDLLLGTNFDDEIEGFGGDDTIEGFGGNDLLAGKDGRDLIYGDDGRDTVTGGDDRDWLEGGFGDDVLGGGTESDTIFGGPDDDLIGGDGGADDLIGEQGFDTLVGGAGNDVLEGGRQDDTLDGGPGTDIAIFLANGTEAERVRIDTRTVEITLADGSTDRLIDVEEAEFDDGTLVIGPATAHEGFVFRLYDGVYGREADEGLDFWVAELDAGLSDMAVATAFLESPEYEQRFGSDSTPEDLIDALYDNVLGREADAAGRDYWLAQLDAGASEEAMMLAFTESAENVAAHAEALEVGVFYLV